MESPQQPSQAPPVGRALRILLGLALMVYVEPVYFQVPVQLSVRVLLLMLGLVGVYSLIQIVISRRILPLILALELSSPQRFSSHCMLAARPGYRLLATEWVNWQQSRFSASRCWLLGCGLLPVAK